MSRALKLQCKVALSANEGGVSAQATSQHTWSETVGDGKGKQINNPGGQLFLSILFYDWARRRDFHNRTMLGQRPLESRPTVTPCFK